MNSQAGRLQLLNYWLTRMWTDFWTLHPVRRMAYVGVALMLWVFLRVLAGQFVPIGRPWRIAAVASVWVLAVTLFVRRRYSD